MLFLFGAAVAGLVFTRNIRTGGRQTICSMGLFVDKLIEGSSTQSDRWVGLDPLIEKMQIVFDNFNPTTFATLAVTYPATTTVADSALVTAASATATAVVSSFYNDFDDSSVPNPDPVLGGTYMPSYIDDLATTRDDIIDEIESKSDTFAEASLNISTSLIELSAGSVLTLPIQGTINNQLDDASESSRQFSNWTVDGGSSAKNAVDATAGSLFAVFAVDLVLSVGSFLSILLLWKGVQFFRKIINCSWCLIILFTIFGFALSTVLFPAGLVLVESCEVADKIATDSTFFNTFFDKYMPEQRYETSREIMYDCFFGDGEVLETLNVRQYFTTFDPLLYSLDNTYSMTELPGNTVINSELIPENQELVEQLRTGLVSDDGITDTALNKLNAFTNGRACSRVRDLWVLNSDNCPAGTMVFESSDSSTYNLYSPTCIGFEDWGTSHTISQRYTTTSFPQPGCGQFDGDDADVVLSDLVNQFVTSREEVDTLFSDVQGGLTDVETANEAFMTVVKSATSRITPVRTGADPIYQALGSPTEGILRNSNCKWVIESYNDFQDLMCVRFVTGVFQTGVVMIVASFIGLFASFTLFCFAKRSYKSSGRRGEAYSTTEVKQFV